MEKFTKPKNSLLDMKDIMFLWKLLYKNLAIIILVPVVSYLIGYIYAYRLNDVHGAHAQLLLKSNETYDYQDPIYKGLGAYSTYTDIQNQMRILKSRGLIGEVIDKLDFEISQYIVGRLRRHEVYFTLPFQCNAEVHNKSFFETPIGIEILDASAYKLEYEFEGQTHKVNGNFEDTLRTNHFSLFLSKLYGFDEEGLEVTKKSNYEIIIHSRDYLIAKYQSNLSVENIDFTSILNVSVTDEIANRGLVFLDSLCNTYIEYSRRIQLEVNQNTIDNIQKQIDTVQRFILEKENSIINYRENNSILDIDKEGEQYFDDYVELTKSQRVLEEQKSSAALLEKYMKSEFEGRTFPPYFFIEKSDIYLAEVLSELRSKQSKLETMRTQVSEDNERFKIVKDEINVLKGDIKIYLTNLIAAIDSRIVDLNSAISENRGKITNLPKSAQDILNIQRELDVNNKMYLFLLERKTNTLITRAGIIPQVRIIEETRQMGVVRPDKPKMRLLALFAGLILALLIALVRSLFFARIENVRELDEATGLSILGGIPYLTKNESTKIAVNVNPKSHFTESFRRMRTNLSFLLDSNNTSNVILISSYFPGEGKTFTSSNLAVMLANTDKKVLILDFDLHKPKINKMFDLENTKGLSSFLIGRSTIEALVNKSQVNNLDIITAGPIPPNPSELILKNKVLELFKWARENYDFIVVDTPPFGLLNDAIVMSQYADVFMVVANTSVLRKKGVGLIEEIINKTASNAKGIVLNGVKQRKLDYYYSKYVYKYNYGYSYGYGETYGENYFE